MSTEQRGSRSRFLNFIRFSVMEMPTPPSRGYTVTMLSWGRPFRLKEVSTPWGLSWMNCSIWGASSACFAIGSLLRERVSARLLDDRAPAIRLLDGLGVGRAVLLARGQVAFILLEAQAVRLAH